MTPEQRAARVHYHMYSTNEGIAEHAERIVALEELVVDMWTCISENQDGDCTYCSRLEMCNDGISDFEGRMSDLGIEKESE